VGILLAAPYSLLTIHACYFTSIKILLLLLLLPNLHQSATSYHVQKCSGSPS
jgi:hypothetical protein